MQAASSQTGMTLIEVLVALLILSLGVLGGAMLQLGALKYTDSSARSLQVSFIAHDLFERIRANPEGNYALASLDQAPVTENPDVPRDQDLFDFATQLRQRLGDDVQASIAQQGSSVRMTLTWNDSRAGQDMADTQTWTLSSRVSAEPGARP